jgi:hypothetical protein
MDWSGRGSAGMADPVCSTGNRPVWLTVVLRPLAHTRRQENAMTAYLSPRLSVNDRDIEPIRSGR